MSNCEAVIFYALNVSPCPYANKKRILCDPELVKAYYLVTVWQQNRSDVINPDTRNTQQWHTKSALSIEPTVVEL